MMPLEKKLAELLRWLTQLFWRENAMSTKRFSMPELDGLIRITDVSAHPKNAQQQAASTPAFVGLLFTSKATLWYRHKIF